MDVVIASPLWIAGVAAAVLLGVLTGLATGPLLRRAGRRAELDQTRAAPDASTGVDSTRVDSAGVDADDLPPDYAGLASVRLSLAVGLTAAAAGALVVTAVPAVAWPVWVALVSVGVLLGWIDAATTWLPVHLTHALWAGTGAGLVVSTVIVALVRPPGPDWWWLPLGAAIGAVAYSGFLWVVWRLSRGQLGYGDVQLALALGAVTGACSLPTVFVAALLGTTSAAVWAVVLAVRGHRNPFPYGPFLLFGAFLAPLLT